MHALRWGKIGWWTWGGEEGLCDGSQGPCQVLVGCWSWSQNNQHASFPFAFFICGRFVFLLGCNNCGKEICATCLRNEFELGCVCVHWYCQHDCDHLSKMCWLEENVLIKHGTYLILTMVLHTTCFLLLWFCVCILVANRDYLVHSQPPTPTPKKSRKKNKTILLS